MLAFDTTDARADILSWREAGLQVYEPFDFSKTSTTPDGENVTLGFSLAFVSHPAAPSLGLLACQYKRRQFYAQPQYQNHSNAASTVHLPRFIATPFTPLTRPDTPKGKA